MSETRRERPAEVFPGENAEILADVPAEQQADAQKRRRRRIRALRSFLIRLIGFALVIYILFFHVVGLTAMPNGDMAPRMDAGDLLLFYRIDRTPRIRDVAVIRKADTGKQYVLRVVAAPGDTVDVTEENGLSINGNVQIESNIYSLTRPYENGTEYPVILKDGEYFVMADLRNGGMDSRYFGPVKQEEIEGIVITLLRRNSL